jgi:hypothetical protein
MTACCDTGSGALHILGACAHRTCPRRALHCYTCTARFLGCSQRVARWTEREARCVCRLWVCVDCWRAAWQGPQLCAQVLCEGSRRGQRQGGEEYTIGDATGPARGPRVTHSHSQALAVNEPLNQLPSLPSLDRTQAFLNPTPHPPQHTPFISQLRLNRASHDQPRCFQLLLVIAQLPHHTPAPPPKLPVWQRAWAEPLRQMR